jgi:NitT/TauT family transport system permease protein
MSGIATATRLTVPIQRQVTAWATPGTLSLLAGAVAWELLGRAWQVNFFPPLSEVLARLVELTASGQILSNLLDSLLNLVIGFGISVVLGIGVGMFMGANRRVETALDVYVYTLLTAPHLVFAPIFLAIFGLDNPRASIVSLIILYCVFIIMINTVAAIRGVPMALIEMGRSYDATESQLFLKIIMPAALPMIFAGLRLGIGRAVKGMINGEMFITAVGLGAVVQNSSHRFDAAGVLAVLIVIIVVAIAAAKIVQAIDGRMTSWLPSTARQSAARGPRQATGTKTAEPL